MKGVSFDVDGKELKPFLCLIKNLYHDLVLTNPNSKKPSKDPHLKKLQTAFPYYSKQEFNDLFDLLVNVFKVGEDKENIERLYKYYFKGLYAKQRQHISGERLYHFVKKDFIPRILESKFLYPSVVSLDEYKVLYKKYEGPLQFDKMNILEDREFQTKWNNSNSELINLRNSGASKEEVDTFIQNDAFMPALTCFTELGISQISLHARHYGSYGLIFEKDPTAFQRLKNGEIQSDKIIRPIYYSDNVRSCVPWSLLKLLRNADLEEQRSILIDLAFIKPIDPTLFHPDNIHSVFYEKEWRYASYSATFSFTERDMRGIVVADKDYKAWLHGQEDPTLQSIHDFCEAHKIELITI